MAGDMVKHNALSEVEGGIVERLPVQRGVQVVTQVDTSIGSGGDRIESRLELPLVHPDGDVLHVLEEVETASVVEVQVSDDNCLDVLVAAEAQASAKVLALYQQ